MRTCPVAAAQPDAGADEPAEASAPRVTRAVGPIQPRSTASTKKKTTPRSVTTPPAHASARAPSSTLRSSGGAVTLLGVVFFFVLAVDRGWIGPTARVTLGASASAVLVGAGLWLRKLRRHIRVGLGGGRRHRGLLHDPARRGGALRPDPGSARIGRGRRDRRRRRRGRARLESETLASLGLVGAMLVPIPVAFQDDLTALGTAFACLVLAAATVVAVLRGWRGLLVASVVGHRAAGDRTRRRQHMRTRVPSRSHSGSSTRPARSGSRSATRISYLPASLLMFSAAFGGWSAAVLFDGHAQGFALLGVALAYAAASVGLYRRDRDTASVLVGDRADTRGDRRGVARLRPDADDRVGSRGSGPRVARASASPSRASSSPRSPGSASRSRTGSPSMLRPCEAVRGEH